MHYKKHADFKGMSLREVKETERVSSFVHVKHNRQVKPSHKMHENKHSHAGKELHLAGKKTQTTSKQISTTKYVTLQRGTICNQTITEYTAQLKHSHTHNVHITLVTQACSTFIWLLKGSAQSEVYSSTECI